MDNTIPPGILNLGFEEQQRWLQAEAAKGRYYAKLAAPKPIPEDEKQSLIDFADWMYKTDYPDIAMNGKQLVEMYFKDKALQSKH